MFIYHEQPLLEIWEDTRQAVEVLSKNSYIFNVGSVGQPRDGDWRASFAVFDT